MILMFSQVEKHCLDRQQTARRLLGHTGRKKDAGKDPKSMRNEVKPFEAEHLS